MTDRASYIFTDSFGDDNTLYPKLNFYVSGNNLYLGFDNYDPEFDAMVPYCDATVNIEPLPYLQACIDTNNNGPQMIDFLVSNGFGEPTGHIIPSGFCFFPVFQFHESKLREIDPETFAAYAKAHGKDKPKLDAAIDQAKTKSENHCASHASMQAKEQDKEH